MSSTEAILNDPELLETAWDLSPLVDGDEERGVERALDEARERAERFATAHAGRIAELDSAGLVEAMDELAGISWTKGCYMGQELTARTRYRGLVKRRLVPVAVDGPLPARGTPITLEGEQVGEMRSGIDGLGLAQLRLPALRAASLQCGTASLRPQLPTWLRLPTPASA